MKARQYPYGIYITPCGPLAARRFSVCVISHGGATPGNFGRIDEAWMYAARLQKTWTGLAVIETDASSKPVFKVEPDGRARTL